MCWITLNLYTTTWKCDINSDKEINKIPQDIMTGGQVNIILFLSTCSEGYEEYIQTIYEIKNYFIIHILTLGLV